MSARAVITYVLQVEPKRAREREALEVGALALEVVHAVAVRNARDLLTNDRTLVKIRRHKVRGGTDELDATRMCSVVRPRPFKGWQEAVVDVDRPPTPLLSARARTKHASQHARAPILCRTTTHTRLPRAQKVQVPYLAEVV